MQGYIKYRDIRNAEFYLTKTSGKYTKNKPAQN